MVKNDALQEQGFPAACIGVFLEDLLSWQK
jgi:hypothetical protein